MPGTLTGLFIFVILLAPGFVFLLISERGLVAGRDVSALRETATIGLTSGVFDVASVLITILLLDRTALPGPDLDRLVAEGTPYMREEWRATGAWFLIALGFACLMAAFMAGWANRTDRFARLRSRPPLRWFSRGAGGTQYVSAWWKVLVDPTLHPDKLRYVTCQFHEGGGLAGWLLSASHEAADSPDRELVLSAPLQVIDSDGEVSRLPTGAVTISASRIQYLHVRYLDQVGDEE